LIFFLDILDKLDIVITVKRVSNVGIGKRIREARESKGLTQKELGDAVGVTASATTNYESETSHPKEPVLYSLFAALDKDPNFFFQDCVQIENPATISDDGLSAGAKKLADELSKQGLNSNNFSDEDIRMIAAMLKAKYNT
jgi:transcriptional regulator with XRE-family HTH domain